jgi:hypothetical protein
LQSAIWLTAKLSPSHLTVMAGIRGDKANRHPREELVVVLVSAQEKTMRLLDDSEDNPLRCRKQETH